MNWRRESSDFMDVGKLFHLPDNEQKYQQPLNREQWRCVQRPEVQ
jgi:hypothetical protein